MPIKKQPASACQNPKFAGGQAGKSRPKILLKKCLQPGICEPTIFQSGLPLAEGDKGLGSKSRRNLPKNHHCKEKESARSWGITRLFWLWPLFMEILAE